MLSPLLTHEETEAQEAEDFILGPGLGGSAVRVGDPCWSRAPGWATRSGSVGALPRPSTHHRSVTQSFPVHLRGEFLSGHRSPPLAPNLM